MVLPQDPSTDAAAAAAGSQRTDTMTESIKFEPALASPILFLESVDVWDYGAEMHPHASLWRAACGSTLVQFSSIPRAC